MKLREICLAAAVTATTGAWAGTIDLGSAGGFAVLAGTTVTNTGATVISGDVGLWPGTAITGFPPAIFNPGVLHATDAVALQAQGALTTAYNSAASAACGNTLSGQNLGGMTLTPGTYCFGSIAQLTGTLTLDVLGDPNAVFLFQIGSTLTTAGSSSVVFVNGGQGSNVFWQVGSSATLGTTTSFAGNILALTSISLNTGASIVCGSALARNGAVTMDTNRVSACTAAGGSPTGVPEPSTASLMLVIGAACLYAAKRRSNLKLKSSQSKACLR